MLLQTLLFQAANQSITHSLQMTPPPPPPLPLHPQGTWADDARAGFGKYFYINGDTYEGEWQNHSRHGRGTYTYADTGTKYIGMWSYGKWNGHGELIHANHKYVGTFREGKVSGQETRWCGVVVFREGKRTGNTVW